jgi:hypothetical protein
MENHDITPQSESPGWSFSTLADVWDDKIRAMIAAAFGAALTVTGLVCVPMAVATPGQCWSSPFGGFSAGVVRSYVIGPRWCGPVYGGGLYGGGGGCYGLPCTYYPYSYGFGCAPIVVSPFGGSIAPVYGPAGVLPFMGFSASAVPARVQSIAASGPNRSPAAHLAALAPAREAVAPPAPPFAVRNVSPSAFVWKSGAAFVSHHRPFCWSKSQRYKTMRPDGLG